MALKQVKNKIQSTKKTGQVTKAMESVSAVKMRKSQERALASRPYVQAAMRILMRVLQVQEANQHPLLQHREAGRHLLVIVTSDKGLAGSVNSAVLKQAEQYLAQQPETDIIAVGRKAADFARREQKTILTEYTNVGDDVTVADVEAMTQATLISFTKATYQKVVVLYQNFLSTFEQEPTMRTVLPLDPGEVHYLLQGIVPSKGKFSEQTTEPDTKVAYLLEPNAESVLNSLLPQLVQIIFYHALLESKASEHSARMVAMKNATDKSKEVIKALTIEYNKERQASITAEVSEITAGAEAMQDS